MSNKPVEFFKTYINAIASNLNQLSEGNETNVCKEKNINMEQELRPLIDILVSFAFDSFLDIITELKMTFLTKNANLETFSQIFLILTLELLLNYL